MAPQSSLSWLPPLISLLYTFGVARHPHIAVIGAGAFGGWTAWHLLQRGARVTLVDAWGAGHPRGTSSGETRLIRCGYGHKPLYTEWTVRALQLWKHWQREWKAPLFINSGVLWLCAREDDYICASIAALRKHKVPHERLSRRDLARRYPQFSTKGIAFAYWEPRAGFLRAKVATEAVARAVAAHRNGRVLLDQARAPHSGRKESALLASLETRGGKLRADFFVFACGPWLPQLFPDLLGRRIRATKQEIFFFGLPAGESRFTHPVMSPWIEIHSDFYGVPAFDGRGFKIACDRPGPLFDPTTGDRSPEMESLRAARKYLAMRFPAMKGAPLAEVRVCQYERTPDANLVLDRHPRFGNVWLVGGGSGHGFKLGPAVGEMVAEQVLAARPRAIPPQLRLGTCEWPQQGPVPVTRSF